MKRQHTTVSPVLMELIVAILFLALSMSVVIRLIAAADTTSKGSERLSRAMIAMQDLAEGLKNEPPDDGRFDENGELRFTDERADDICLMVLVRRSRGAVGTMYDIAITAVYNGEDIASLKAARYIRGGGAGA